MGERLSVREAAQYLGRSEAFLRSLCDSDTPPFRKVKGGYYLVRCALEEWVHAGAPDPASRPSPVPPRVWRGRRRGG